ncbi:MAG: LLM class flavin-dependent oxidoreductase [Anaerolineae bacterium]|nr:LLM class flavin-dependent oxidoreductase [Anaerolineae bacterium]
MDFGVHLPLIDFGSNPFSLQHLLDYAELAEQLGYQALSVNDHMLFSRPWLDGPTALAAVLPKTGHMTLATTLALPTVRGPVALAKSLAAIDLLSGGRLIVGVGPGSSARDYAAVGIPFEERWKRLDESIQALRVLWSKDALPFKGQFYNTEGIALEPRPAQQAGIPLWLGSWGSVAGLRRVANLADGWLASGYNTTPQEFAQAWIDLRANLQSVGKDPASFPNAVATMWFYVTDNRAEAQRMLEQVLSPMLKRPVDVLGDRLPIGSAEECAEKLAPYRAAGAQRIFLWPLGDDLKQLEMFQKKVVPLLPS